MGRFGMHSSWRRIGTSFAIFQKIHLISFNSFILGFCRFRGGQIKYKWMDEIYHEPIGSAEWGPGCVFLDGAGCLRFTMIGKASPHRNAGKLPFFVAALSIPVKHI